MICLLADYSAGAQGAQRRAIESHPAASLVASNTAARSTPAADTAAKPLAQQPEAPGIQSRRPLLNKLTFRDPASKIVIFPHHRDVTGLSILPRATGACDDPDPKQDHGSDHYPKLRCTCLDRPPCEPPDQN